MSDATRCDVGVTESARSDGGGGGASQPSRGEAHGKQTNGVTLSVY